VTLPRAEVREVRSVWTLEHHERVLADPRTRRLLANSILFAAGAALVALLLGLPCAWLFHRTEFPGRRFLFPLALAPAVLPPFVLALGAAKPIGSFLAWATGLTGQAVQAVNGSVVLGCALAPVVTLLVGRALAAVAAGPWEAALLLGGPRAAFARVVWPACRPALAGALVLVFALALSDFAVPDILSFVLPPGGEGFPVFAKEVQIQWANEGNHARAVATGTPLLLATGLLLLLALRLLSASPSAAGNTRGARPRVVLRARGRLAASAFLLPALGLSLVVPLGGILSFALGAGETAASGSAGTPAASAGGRLFDFAGALERTAGVGEDWWRWIRIAGGTAILTAFVAVALARWAVRGGRAARVTVLSVAGLSLATPGVVLGLGTLLLWIDWGGTRLAGGTALAVLADTARFLPYALLAAWLAIREVPRAQEEAAAVLGAGPAERAARIWLPLSARGIAAGALLAFLLALRELDAIVLLESQVFPIRLYDKIHYSRLADEANLTLLYLGHLLLPALALALLLGRSRRPESPGGR
jgi:iron(III) transport system permease protein